MCPLSQLFCTYRYCSQLNNMTRLQPAKYRHHTKHDSLISSIFFPTNSCQQKSRAHHLFGMTGVEEPPGITPRRLSQPPMMPPACCSISCFSGIDISSSTVHGLFTWPEMLYNCTAPNICCTDNHGRKYELYLPQLLYVKQCKLKWHSNKNSINCN